MNTSPHNLLGDKKKSTECNGFETPYQRLPFDFDFLRALSKGFEVIGGVSSSWDCNRWHHHRGSLARGRWRLLTRPPPFNQHSYDLRLQSPEKTTIIIFSRLFTRLPIGCRNQNNYCLNWSVLLRRQLPRIPAPHDNGTKMTRGRDARSASLLSLEVPVIFARKDDPNSLWLASRVPDFIWSGPIWLCRPRDRGPPNVRSRFVTSVANDDRNYC